MNMFQSLLNSIPKNRSEMVEDLEIPDVALNPYEYTEPEESFSSLRSDSEEFERGTLSTDSSIPLSRAMTDSEIDYGFYKRYKRCGFSDPCEHMRVAMDTFPSDYLASLSSFVSTDTEDELLEDSYLAELAESRRLYREELKAKMERFFDDECCVFTPDDPGLLDLQDALRSLDMKASEADLATIGPLP